MNTNKIIIFSAVATALSLVGAIGENAYAILSYTFLYIIHNNNGFNYTYVCTGYYYPGDKYFRSVNCNPESLNIVYYYCNQLILFNDGYGHLYWTPNPYCHNVAPIKPGSAQPPAQVLPSQLPHPHINNNNSQSGSTAGNQVGPTG